MGEELNYCVNALWHVDVCTIVGVPHLYGLWELDLEVFDEW